MDVVLRERIRAEVRGSERHGVGSNQLVLFCAQSIFLGRIVIDSAFDWEVQTIDDFVKLVRPTVC